MNSPFDEIPAIYKDTIPEGDGWVNFDRPIITDIIGIKGIKWGSPTYQIYDSTNPDATAIFQVRIINNPKHKPSTYILTDGKQYSLATFHYTDRTADPYQPNTPTHLRLQYPNPEKALNKNHIEFCIEHYLKGHSKT